MGVGLLGEHYSVWVGGAKGTECFAHPDQNKTASFADIDDHYLISCTGGPSSHRDTFEFKYFWMTGITKHVIAGGAGGGGAVILAPPPLNFYNIVPHYLSLSPSPRQTFLYIALHSVKKN